MRAFSCEEVIVSEMSCHVCRNLYDIRFVFGSVSYLFDDNKSDSYLVDVDHDGYLRFVSS